MQLCSSVSLSIGFIAFISEKGWNLSVFVSCIHQIKTNFVTLHPSWPNPLQGLCNHLVMSKCALWLSFTFHRDPCIFLGSFWACSEDYSQLKHSFRGFSNIVRKTCVDPQKLHSHFNRYMVLFRYLNWSLHFFNFRNQFCIMGVCYFTNTILDCPIPHLPCPHLAYCSSHNIISVSYWALSLSKSSIPWT